MTELVQSVRLKYDGSGVVGQVAGTKKALDEVADSARKLGPASAGIAAIGETSRAASSGLATTAREAGVAGAAIGGIARDAAAATGALGATATAAKGAATAVGSVDGGAALGDVGRMAAAAGVDIATLTAKVRELDAKLGGTTKGTKDLTVSAGQQQAAMKNLGYQLNDFSTSVLGGVSPMMAFTQQSGQVAGALADMGGKAGSVGRFFAGPWGAAVLVGVSVLGQFIPKLLDTSNALADYQKDLDAAAQSADAFGNAQSLLGKVIDLSTGKFKTHNSVLIETIRLQAEAARQKGKDDEREARKGIQDVGELGAGGVVGTFLSRGQQNPFQRVREAQARGASLRGLRDQVLSGDVTDATEIRQRIDTMERLGQLAGYTAEQIGRLKLQLIALPGAVNAQRAAQLDIDALDGKGVAPELKPYERAKKARTKKPADTDDLVAGVKGDIQSLTAEFSDVPTFVEKARAAIAKLDVDAAKLEKRKPPNYQGLVDEVRAAQGVIRDNLDKPFADFLKKQEQSFAVSQLLAGGHVDEANALRIVHQLQEQMGPLTDAQKTAVLGVVQATRALGQEQEANADRLRKYHQAADELRSAFQDAFTGGVRGVAELPKQLVGAFSRLQSAEIFDRLFDGAFRKLQDQIDGTSTVQNASEKMAGAIGTTVNPLNRLATAAENAAAGVAGGVSGGGAAQVLDGGGNVVGSFAAPAAPVRGDQGTTVNGNRTHSALGLFQEGLTKLAKGVGISDDAARTIGTKAGLGIEGAAKGALVASVFNPIAGALGIKTSKTGATLGGAIGNIAEASGIPAASIVGPIVGSVLGGLLKTTKFATATVTNGAVTAGGSNSASRAKVAAADATSVASGVQAIVDQLGGTLGDYKVSIGKYKDSFRVSGTGYSGKLGGSDSRNAREQITAYDTEEEAVRAAIADAIADGAVGGISAAMRKALADNADVDKGVAAALKVRNVEDILTGLGADLVAQFRSLEQQAKARVEIARRYGFDVAKIEAYNAEQRAALVKNTLVQETGGLRAFLDDLATGSLSEGDAATKRQGLLDRIAAAKADQAGGVSGAGNTLAGLLQSLVETTRANYGTAGTEYAADRAMSQTAAETAINLERDRIQKAQDAVGETNTKLADANKLADEGNDLLASAVSTLGDIRAALTTIAASGGGSGLLNVRQALI